MSSVQMRNVLVLLGIILTAGGILYFAVEFGVELSEWGRVLDLFLLGVVFIALGAHFNATGDPTELVERSGWRWLRVTNALYILGATATFAALIAFFAVPDLRPIWKVAIAIVVGLALILVAARRWGPPSKAP
ncbi:MAG TPA: hypothetical protein VM370_10395 [Candidatus Thermoplasmatota archaeon]|nr:hypothetical protein [Candidatus Thermoplasmatota archaeon]